VLFGRIRSGVLALLYGRPDQRFYTRQIAREVVASVGAVQRELGQLAHVGLVVRTSVGNQVFYQANRHNPVFTEMRSLISKTAGALSILRSALERLSKRIVVAFVYGSMARQEQTAQSDIDLMIIGAAKLDEVLSRLAKVEIASSRPVNPTVYSVAEFKTKLASGNHFVNAVINGEKVFLLGNEDDLRKMGGARMAKAGTH
jgi:predicted nucleotidyltransferase